MSLFANTKKYKQKEESQHTIKEISVESYVPIIGKFSKGPYEFMISENTFKEAEDGKPHRLYLRFKNYFEKGKDGTEMAIGDVDSDFIACASLFLKTHFKMIGLTKIDNQPIKFPSFKSPARKALIQGEKKLEDLSEWFNRLFALNEKDYNKFLISVRMHHLTLEILEQDVNLAYLLLIFSIEVLSGNYKIPISFNDLEGYEKIGSLLEENIEDVKIVEKIKNEIAKKQLHIKKKFIAFIEEYSPDSFWKYSNVKYAFAKVEREELKNYLNLIYDYRSLMVHNGIALFEYQSLAWIGEKWDIYPGWPCVFDKTVDFIRKKLIEDEREFAGKKSITLKRMPSIFWFERLVNSVLKRYLETLTEKSTSAI